ncbi:MAG TPA: HAMP domain-containing sensor histidine kinase [Polyangia bacterium]|jgi:signal transduction histidine kinase|nr:HAMP domain-containing sensor histidine kinase [Polyangia bacterium]
MRLRIIAYGVAVLIVLTSVSIATFAVMRRRLVPRPPSSGDGLARSLATADATTRQRLLDEALEANDEVSVYAPDGALVATNVRPPIPPRPNRFTPMRPPFGGPVRFVGGGPSPPPPPPSDDGAALDDGPRRTRPESLLIPRPGRTPPEMFMAPGGLQVVVRPAEPSLPVAPFAIPLVASMVGLVLLSFPVTAAMTRKLGALADAARRFGEGDLGQRANASGSDEVSRTAQAFNTMAERIGELRLRERELLANVSHELRTPMARMAVLLELTENKPAEATRYIGELARDLRELESLLESIIETLRLDLASPRAREAWPMQRVQLDLRDLVAEIADDFRVRAPGSLLTVNLASAPVLREVDRTLVRRAVMNLLDNARKYSPLGSEIRLAIDAGGAVLVGDHGQGVEAADVPHVFEPFFRADRSRSRSTGGLGLGLTFVKLVAILHQGSVSVQSEPGAGSTFRLALG